MYRKLFVSGIYYILIVNNNYIMDNTLVLKRACVKYNIQYAYARMRYFRESRSMRAGYKRGVVRPEVLGHAHKYGGQIQTQSKAVSIDRVSALHITQARSNTIFG